MRGSTSRLIASVLSVGHFWPQFPVDRHYSLKRRPRRMIRIALSFVAGILAVVSQSIVGAKPLTQPWSISRHLTIE